MPPRPPSVPTAPNRPKRCLGRPVYRTGPALSIVDPLPFFWRVRGSVDAIFENCTAIGCMPSAAASEGNGMDGGVA